jgi:uncharacterized protein (DUF2267 family)
MTTPGINLDRSVDEMDAWLDGVMQTLQTDNRQRAYQALEGTLPALRERLSSETASTFGRQMPVLIRGLFFNDPDTPDADHDHSELERFFATVRAPFSANLRIDAHAIAAAVFDVLDEQFSAEETAKIRAELPADLQRLWQTTGDATPPAAATPDELH